MCQFFNIYGLGIATLLYNGLLTLKDQCFIIIIIIRNTVSKMFIFF